MSEPLFTVTLENLDTGLRGYPVGYCVTSTVDPVKGLFYGGIPVADLASCEPEQVIYLLYTGNLGNKSDVDAFSLNLRKRATCNKEVLRHIRALPKHGNPMKLFSAAILIAGMFQGKNDYREDSLNLIAQIPEITAAVINHHAGWGESKPSRPALGIVENFVQMLNVPGGNNLELTQAFKLFTILHYDHGGGNLSTFVGKSVSSGLEDMYGSICASMCALAGPKHGRANIDCLEFVEEVLREVGENATPQQVNLLIRDRMSRDLLIFGFGHAVLRVEDPRATVQFALADRKYPNHPLVKIARLLRTEGSKVLSLNPKIADPFPNVDAISGTLLTASGFPYPEYYTLLFGMSRVVGIAIQIVYDRCEARGGKGTPIVRPKYIYKSR